MNEITLAEQILKLKLLSVNSQQISQHLALFNLMIHSHILKNMRMYRGIQSIGSIQSMRALCMKYAYEIHHLPFYSTASLLHCLSYATYSISTIRKRNSGKFLNIDFSIVATRSIVFPSDLSFLNCSGLVKKPIAETFFPLSFKKSICI